MQDEINRWIEKAEGDFRVASREIKVTDKPNYDAILFHCQQCIEKLLKGALIKHGIKPHKTHDLFELSQRLIEVFPDWSANQSDLIWLSKGAADFRYPGDSADFEEAAESFELCKKLRDRLLPLIQPDFMKSSRE
jgi:HEPN domain-containing protein